MSPIALECGSGGPDDPCCPATNLLLTDLLAAVLNIDADAEACCADTQTALAAILVVLGDILAASGGAAVERHVDGDIQVGVGTIVIPDGVQSYAVSVLAGGDDVTDLSTWVTIDGPDFTAPVPLRNGQSTNAGGDGANTIAGPITVDVPADAAANATWVFA